MLRKTFSIIIALIIICIFPVNTVFSQENTNFPIYIVQPGENLTEIAVRFNIDVNELIAANGIVDANLISAGTELIIPGLDGISGYLVTRPVNIGETLQDILRSSNLKIDEFLLLNDLTSQGEIFVGSNLVLPENAESSNLLNALVHINENENLFLVSVKSGNNLWNLAKNNHSRTFDTVPGEVFYFKSSSDKNITSSFSETIQRIEISPLPVIQGHTASIKIYTDIPFQFRGTLNNRNLNFFLSDDQTYYYTLDGIYAMATIGLAPLHISGESESGEKFSIDQMILLESGKYPEETLTVQSTLIEKPIVEAENAEVQSILSTVIPQKFWNEPFRLPVDGSFSDDTVAFTSYYGSRRTFNNGEYSGFHGGLDFKIVLNTLNIYAAAPGKIIYTGPMNIRGITTFIDHGQGVVSGYAHQSETYVNVGDIIQAGDLIGMIGNTGRVTGPHLHWDIWVNGNQIDPFDWLNNHYP